MKSAAIALNSLGIVCALFLYLGFKIIEPLIVSAILVLSLIAILELANKGFALVLLILNVCTTCASIIVLGVILFGDAIDSYPLSMPLALLIVIAYIMVIVINILILKETAGVQQSK